MHIQSKMVELNDVGIANARIAELEEALKVAYARIRALEEAIIDTQKGLDPNGHEERVAAYRNRKWPWLNLDAYNNTK